MSDSIQIETINSYTKNTTKEVGNFPIATGAITNCPVPVNSVSSVSVFSPPPLILEPLNVPPIIPTPQIFGCTDPNAINYNPVATVNNGTCVYPVLGCTDPNALNYNPSATINDGSCTYPLPAISATQTITQSQNIVNYNFNGEIYNWDALVVTTTTYQRDIYGTWSVLGSPTYSGHLITSDTYNGNPVSGPNSNINVTLSNMGMWSDDVSLNGYNRPWFDNSLNLMTTTVWDNPIHPNI